MKLTAFFLTAFLTQAAASSYSQQITFSGKNVSLETIFSVVEKQTGYVVFYNYSAIKDSRKITINARSMSLKDFLDECIENQSLTYSVENKTVLVTKAKPSSFPSLTDKISDTSKNPPIDVRGRVVDAAGKALQGINVMVKGTNRGVTTDNNGMFSIEAKSGEVLVVTSVEFVAKEILLNAEKFISVSLIREQRELQEVIVNKGYYTESQKLSTSNVVTVGSKDIEKQPVSNPLLALHGRVAGLQIKQATGVAGSAVTVRIQGENSIGKGNEPLYVIDGVPYTAQLNPTSNLGTALGSARGSFANGSPMSYLNPGDIESIDVLKDADATAIYGSRASNGAILITTKSGKAGQTRLNLNYQQGWGKIPKFTKMLNTQQYLEMRREAYRNEGLPVPDHNTIPDFTNYDLTFYDTEKYTDWQKVLLGGTSKYTDAQLNISGGTNNIQYLVGANYHRETSVFPGNFNDQKASMLFNINSVSDDQKFRMKLSGSYLFDDNRLPTSDLTADAQRMAPNSPDLFNSDGTLNWALDSAGNSTWSNSFHPLQNVVQNYRSKGKNLIANFIVGYQIVPGLELRGNFGYTNLITDEVYTAPLSANAPAARPSSQRAALYSDNSINTWLIEPQLNYAGNIGIGKLEALLGTTIQQNYNEGRILFASGHNSDDVLTDILAATAVTVDKTIMAKYKYNALFGRLNYNLSDKYIVNITGRRDGSSRFGPENRFHDFWGLGGAWIFSEEHMIQKKISWLSFGKLRASYGSTGNDQIGDYQFLSLFSQLRRDFPYQNVNGLEITRLTNPYLQWEETKKLQFGLDIGILRDRVMLNAGFYRNRSSNQLLDYSLPFVTGFRGITRNFPAVLQNKGWELILNTVNIKTSKLTWTSNINLTIPRNKLVEFPNLATSTYANTLIIGQPTNITRGVRYAGVDPQTGDYTYFNKKGERVNSFSFPDDYYVVINPNQKFYGGFLNSIVYGNFQLEILLQFVKQPGANFTYGAFPGGVFSNQPVSVLDRWQKPGDEAKVGKFYVNYRDPNVRFYTYGSIDAAVTDASFIRGKNVSLSWQVPNLWIKKAGFKSMQLYAHAQNLFTITSFMGGDPENATKSNIAPLRTITLGIKAAL